MAKQIPGALAGLVALATILAGIAIAQTAYNTRIEGTVYVRKDGEDKYVSGALVEIYALNKFKGEWKTRTSKRGFYTQNGLLLYGDYIVIVSGPGLEPAWSGLVRPDQKNTINIVARPGDGTRLSLEEVLSRINNPQMQPASAPEPAPWSGMPKMLTAISEMDRAKIDGAIKEYESKETPDQKAVAALKEARARYLRGVEMMKAEDYQGASIEFEKAASDVNPSSFPAIAELSCKANAYAAEAQYALGVKLFNENKRDEARPRFEKASEAISRAAETASRNAEPARAADLIAYYEILAKNVLVLVEHFGVVDSVNATLKAIDKAESIDTAGKPRWGAVRGRLFVLLGRTDEAKAAFKKVLDADPKNLDALYGMSLILGVSTEKEKLQEASQHLSVFISSAPATDNRMQEVKTLLESLKAQLATMAEQSSKRPNKPEI